VTRAAFKLAQPPATHNNNPLNYVDPSGHCLQYAGEHGDADALAGCVYAWNALGEYYAGTDVLYDTAVDTVAVGMGILTAAATFETGPFAIATGTMGYVTVQAAAIKQMDPIVDNFQAQTYQQAMNMWYGYEVSR